MWTFLRKKMKKKTGTLVEASASEYLAITGAGIDGDLKLAKTWLLRPRQHCSRFSISPHNYVFDVRAMSDDKVTFRLHTVLTVGPNVSAATGDFCGAADDPLHLYARLISSPWRGESHVRHLVESAVRAEIRDHAGELAMEEIFGSAQEFKNWVKRVFEQVQLDLDPIGIFVYNFNVKPPVQEPLDEHLSHLALKTTQDHLYQRRVKAVLAMEKVDSHKNGRRLTETRAVIVGDDKPSRPIDMPPWDIGDHLGTMPDSTVWTDKHIIVWN